MASAMAEENVRRHVADGMQVTHLGLVYDNVMSFVLDENGVLTKIRFLGMDDAADDDLEPVARLDAEFVPQDLLLAAARKES